jgi:hypothetical protein
VCFIDVRNAICSLLAAALVSSTSAFGQALTELDGTGAGFDFPPPVSATATELAWQPGARDEVSTTWEATEYVTHPVTGALSTRPHRFVEIASGMNYFR